MQKVKVVINQTVRRYNVSHKGIKFSSSTNVVGVGKSAYDIYKETTTDNPILNESDWIDSLYGQDGVTPTIGPNGNWFIGDTDTGTVAAPENTVPEKPYFNVPMKCPIPYVGLESEIEEGWSLCNGRNVVGYGLVPDMRGRFIVGADPRTASIPTNSDTNLKNYGTAGNTGGKDNVQLAITELPEHSFKTVIAGSNNEPTLRSDPNASIVDIRDDRSDGNNDYALDGKAGVPTLGKTNTIGGDQPHENRPPYYVVAFIIRTTYQNANGGKSAYDIAILNGFIGTEPEWLDSLNGKSAYHIALDYGFTGSIEQWILSLKGISGNDGRGIASIARTSGNGAAGTTDTYTILYSNNTTSTYQVVNGANGTPGTNGRGIVSNEKTATNGLIDTYTTTYTDGTTDTYTVTNGENGSGGGNIPDNVLIYGAQTLTPVQRIQVQKNIGIASDKLDSEFSIIGYLSGSGVKNDTNFKCTPFINLSSVEFVDFNLYSVGGTFTVCFYDNNKIPILSITNHGQYVSNLGVIPQNAVYVRFTKTLLVAYASQQYFYITYKPIDYISEFDVVNSRLSELDLSNVNINFFAFATLFGYINTGGAIVSNDTNWLHSDFLDIKNIQQFKIDAFLHPSLNSISFYNSNKAYISGYSGATQAVGTATVNVPVGTAYYRICSCSAAFNPYKNKFLVKINLYAEIQDLNEALIPTIVQKNLTPFRSPRRIDLTNKSIYLDGDSITSADYPWFKTSLEALTGGVVTLGGHPAASSSRIASNEYTDPIFQASPNIIIVLFGGNEIGTEGTVGTFGDIVGEPLVTETDINIEYNGTKFIQAVSHKMRKLKEHYYNIRQNANLTGTETEAEKTAKIDSVLNPIIIFCTPLPQKRGEGSHYSLEENWERKRNAVVECCNKYKIHCVDLYRLFNVDFSLEPNWPGHTDTATNYGIYTMDGLHPNKYGYQLISEIICADIGVK